ncbi:hypothetical protein Dsin_020334 [Dipteronia sinensis]|uniref:LTI65/LTI78 PGEED repeat domain-containing protein n=1 Tax=Dipteronia sinensis TaxID=43782 RepID=A0AAE0AA79_9ROSI|nr:hypothetical protein Dsin_020334 [Dipteronia sinensis]
MENDYLTLEVAYLSQHKISQLHNDAYPRSLMFYALIYLEHLRGIREHPRQCPRAIPVISEKHVLTSSVSGGQENEKPGIGQEENEKHSVGQGNENPPSPHKTLTEPVTDKLAPAYATVSDATYAIPSKIQSLTFEPGEDEKALCQVITDAMSPRRSPRDGTVVKKLPKKKLLKEYSKPTERGIELADKENLILVYKFYV